jgi:hypothetical protein
MPRIAPPHTSQRSRVAFSGGRARTVIGVYEPAISRKMLAWSMRLRMTFVRGFQSKRFLLLEERQVGDVVLRLVGLLCGFGMLCGHAARIRQRTGLSFRQRRGVD